MSKRYGSLEVQARIDGGWQGVASIDGGKDEGDKWISQHGQDGKTYRVIRAYPAVEVSVKVTETRTMTAAE